MKDDILNILEQYLPHEAHAVKVMIARDMEELINHKLEIAFAKGKIATLEGMIEHVSNIYKDDREDE